MANQSLESLIDALLAAPKTLAGIPSWEATSWGVGEQRLLWPLYIDDRSCKMDLEINAYPSYGNSKEKWRIKLLMPKCIWRIDYDHDRLHVNSFNKPADLTETSFTAPHYHSWEDNKRFCTNGTVPDKLYNARIMPTNCKTFHNAFRWFCGITNIVIPSPMIDLPPRTQFI